MPTVFATDAQITAAEGPHHHPSSPTANRVLLPAAILLCVTSLATAASHASNSQGIVSPSTTDAARIYRVTCSVCHGERGDGQAFAARSFDPPPTSFIDPATVQSLTRERMLASTSHGRPETAMQPFKHQLTPQQIELVVDHIRATFMNIDVEAEKQVRGDKTTTIAAGRTIYNFRCYICHGYGGDAQTLAALVLDPSPIDFTNPDVMQAMDNGRMFDSIKHGKPETAMKPFASILSDEDIERVIAFMKYAFIEEGAGNIRYHSPDNGWNDFEKKYPDAIRYFLYEGEEGNLPEELRAGKKTFDIACVACHLARRRPAAEKNPLVWRDESAH